jgi:hypothetical protein
MRSVILILVLCATAVLPGSALAVAPINDAATGAAPLTPVYVSDIPSPIVISPEAPAGGWLDATNTEDSEATAPMAPTCFGSAGTHSMWYSVAVPEPSVLTVALTSGDAGLYEPIVTILDPRNNNAQLACALGGAPRRTSVTASASSYIPSAGTYLVRIASAPPVPGDDDEPQALSLAATLRDVTPPHLAVDVSKIVGVNRPVTFDASASSDGAGSGIDPGSAIWTFYDSGVNTTAPGVLVATNSWRTAGFHLVSLTLADRNGNKSTYSFNVFVHSFVSPNVRVRVIVPKPGASSMRVVVTHDMPVRVRLVVLQTGSILRMIPSRVLKGSNTSTSISIALKQKVKKTGNVFVSGTASDLSTYPNTVALRTCSVHPGKRGMVCA